eukprot:COSAG03_NODE_4927_length_1389_cov_13.601550_3_plen_154_part_00
MAGGREVVQSDILRRQSHGKICSLYTSESSLFRKGTTRGCTSQDAHYTPQECNAGRLSGRLSGTQPLTAPLEVNQLLEKLCISLAAPAPIEVSADPARAREREKERKRGRERERGAAHRSGTFHPGHALCTAQRTLAGLGTARPHAPSSCSRV